MNHRLTAFTFVVFSLGIPASSARAQSDLLTAPPTPTVAFLNDHSYDNTDVDGTSLKTTHKTDGSDDLEPIVDPNAAKGQDGENASVKAPKQGSANPAPTREPDINGL